MTLLIAIFGDVVAWTIPQAQVERLRREFPDVQIVHARSEPELLAAVAGADVAFSWRVGPDVFPLAPRLRWIHTPAAGIGSMLTPALRASDVVVTNSRGVHAAPVAEHVLGVSIALARRIHTAVQRQVAHVWAQNELAVPPPRMIRGLRMGIVGLGAIGTEVARLASAIGMRVRATRRRVDRPAPPWIEEVLPLERLDRLLAGSDIVVLAAPLTPATWMLIDRGRLQAMKRDAILVNVGRGKLVDEAALARHLQRGLLGGAALDVFEHEPLDAASPLWDLPNVLITPHTSGTRDDYWEEVSTLFADNLRRYLAGEPLRNVVDKEEGY